MKKKKKKKKKKKRRQQPNRVSRTVSAEPRQPNRVSRTVCARASEFCIVHNVKVDMQFQKLNLKFLWLFKEADACWGVLYCG